MDVASTVPDEWLDRRPLAAGDADPMPARSIVRRLVGAAAVSSAGSGLSAVALGLLTVDVSQDVRWVAGVFVAGQAPWLLLGLWIAGRVDRMPRPGRALLVADAGRMVVMVVCTVAVATGRAGLPLLVATAASMGVGEIVHTAATNIVVPALASGDALARANGHLGAATVGGYDTAGPAVGGLVYGFSRSIPFAADALSYLVSLHLVRPAARVSHGAAPDGHQRAENAGAAVGGRGDDACPDPDGGGRAPGHDVLGTRTVILAVWRTPILRLLSIQIVVLGFAQAMVMSIAPLYGRIRLGLSAGGYGVLLALGAVGAVAGGLAGPRLWRARRHTASLLLGSATVAGCVYVLAAITTVVAVVLPLFVLFSAAVGVANTIAPTLRMEHAPAAARGRVNTLFLQLIFTTQPFGAILSAVLVRRFGIPAAVGTAGAGVIAAMLLLHRPLRRAVAAAGA